MKPKYIYDGYQIAKDVLKLKQSLSYFKKDSVVGTSLYLLWLRLSGVRSVIFTIKSWFVKKNAARIIYPTQTVDVLLAYSTPKPNWKPAFENLANDLNTQGVATGLLTYNSYRDCTNSESYSFGEGPHSLNVSLITRVYFLTKAIHWSLLVLLLLFIKFPKGFVAFLIKFI
jgi:hypothetical protein